jgi:hypothetical protein
VWIYFALSLDDFRDVLLASLSTSAAAMWLAPATPIAIAAALLLITNTMRLFVSSAATPESNLTAKVAIQRFTLVPRGS